MRITYKFKPEIIRFIVNSKLKKPDISCRKLALEAGEKFNIKFSKSAINNILKREKLSSPVGRRSRHLFHPEGKRSNGGFYILKAIDEFLSISKIAARVLINISPSMHKSFAKDIENVMQALVIFKSVSDVTVDLTVCYNNKDVWQIVGRRPPRGTYGRIVKMLQESQLFAEEIVREMKQQLNPIIGFRFRLRDESSFFIDGALNSIWPSQARSSFFPTTHYKSDSYINDIISHEKIISIFNVQDISVFSEDVLDFIAGCESQDFSKQIRQIELLGQEENVVTTRTVSTGDKIFFFLGFWPWQLDIMSEFERRAAKDRFIWSDLGLEYYYQIEEVRIPQHLVNKDVRLIAIILKNSPLGAARMGILTNLPKDVIHNYLSYKELYYWSFPEDRYKDFLKKTKVSGNYPLASSLTALSNILKDKGLNNIFEVLSEIIWKEFQHLFLSENLVGVDRIKIREIFSHQEVVLKPTKELVVHNLVPNNELWKETDIKYTCQRLNEAGIRDARGRLLWFK